MLARDIPEETQVGIHGFRSLSVRPLINLNASPSQCQHCPSLPHFNLPGHRPRLEVSQAVFCFSGSSVTNYFTAHTILLIFWVKQNLLRVKYFYEL
ncbi:hypothetical protein PoB_002801700 [Plakobranchus ocellatus]|uniref:Uncharacterized protein n=1 Tax=Plakobranchus ocellatus TaxID=259542 RepID=A0AAV4A3S6_9GAST|nr:hypothetical protein PoB_002801700 [Plakobranchus ocellatus]